jgi:hypothetical protein
VIRWLALLSLLANLLLPVKSANAAYSTELTGVQAQYQFGGTLSIRAHYDHAADLHQAEFILQSSAGTPTQLSINIAKDGTLSAKVSLAGLNLSPFARIYYWVQFTFLDGSTQTSASYWFDYADNRFNWQTNQSKWFTIHWINGDPTYGNKLQELALAGLKSATQTLPVSPNLPITIYVYPDFSSLPQVTSSEPAWVAAEAIPTTNTILVSTSTDLTSTQDLERQFPHEITHLLEYQLTQANYSTAPAWLLEGLASKAESSPNPDFARVLQNASTSHTLIPMSQLCHSFSPNSDEATIAYAQSASFVTYLTTIYGNDKVEQLLKSSGNGMNCAQLVNSTLGISLDAADAAWQKADLVPTHAEPSLWEYWPLLLVFLCLIAALIFLRRYLLKKKEEHNGRE